MRVAEILAAKVDEMQRELDNALSELATGKRSLTRAHWFSWRDVPAICAVLDALAEASDGGGFDAQSRRLRASSEQLQAAEKRAEEDRQILLNLAGYGQRRCRQLTATDIGRIIVPPIQPADVNRLLVEMGLLQQTERGWFATEAGQSFVYQQLKATPNGRALVYWNERVLDAVLQFRRKQRE